MVGYITIQALNGHIKVEEQRPLAIVADHALDPEKGRNAGATGDGPDIVQARGRIENHVSGRKLHAMCSISVFNDQFAAFVFIRVGEKKRRGEIRANAMRRARYLADGVINMRAERLATLVAIEQRRENTLWQCGRNEERVLAKRFENRLAELHRGGVILRQLQIVFGPAGLMTRCNTAVDPLRGIEYVASL